MKTLGQVAYEEWCRYHPNVSPKSGSYGGDAHLAPWSRLNETSKSIWSKIAKAVLDASASKGKS